MACDSVCVRAPRASLVAYYRFYARPAPDLAGVLIEVAQHNNNDDDITLTHTHRHVVAWRIHRPALQDGRRQIAQIRSALIHNTYVVDACGL